MCVNGVNCVIHHRANARERLRGRVRSRLSCTHPSKRAIGRVPKVAGDAERRRVRRPGEGLGATATDLDDSRDTQVRE